MLMNFDTDLDTAGVARMVKTKESVEIIETVTVTPKMKSKVAVSFIAKDDAQWAWDDLRDYVVHEIETLFGPFPRDNIKEASIFKSFLGRYGDKAPAIARHAFEVHGGRWGGAPISVNRFCKASDQYFADVIAKDLAESAIAGW